LYWPGGPSFLPLLIKASPAQTVHNATPQKKKKIILFTDHDTCQGSHMYYPPTCCVSQQQNGGKAT
jgi:hypothetical protein